MYNEIAELGRETLTQDEYLNEVPGSPRKELLT